MNTISQRVGIKCYLWYMTIATAQFTDNYDTIHTFIPSIRELLTVYDFLTDSEGNAKSYFDLTDARNQFLENLNSENFLICILKFLKMLLQFSLIGLCKKI